MIQYLACALLLSTHTHSHTVDYITARNTCLRVTEAAQGRLPVALAVSLAYWESKLDPDVVNPISGARGPLQVIAKWFCPDGRWDKCGDPVDVGIEAMREWYTVRLSQNTRIRWRQTVHWDWEILDGPLYLEAIEGYVGVGSGGGRGHARQIYETAREIERSETRGVCL